MLKLDLRYKGELDYEITVIFNNIAKLLRGPFTQVVSEVSEPMKGNMDWWVEGPASRNTLVSPLFHYYCAFHLVDELLKKKYNISEILVDSFALGRILKQYFHINGQSIIIKHRRTRLISNFKHITVTFVKIHLELYRYIYQRRCAQKTKHLQKPIPNKQLTLIDTYVLPGYISKDRYYNGLWDNLDSKQKETTFFIPTLVMIPKKKILSTYKELRTTGRNFMIKEDYLKISDILYAIGHCFRIFKFKINTKIVLDVDISSLIKEELWSMRGYSSAVGALLNYRFIRRLKYANLKLRLVVDWWESQALDKGWNAGLNTYYPKTQTIGYLGFAPRLLELHLYPTRHEAQNQVLPSKIATIGAGFVNAAKTFYSDLSVDSSPAFRFQHVWNKSAAKLYSNYFTVLVALSVMPEESFYILKLVKEFMKTTGSENWRFWIKPHPTMPEDTLKKGLHGRWPEEFILIEGPSSDFIPKVDIMISGMSSICLETIALGIPVIVVENMKGLSYNSIPEEIPQDLWRSCRTSNDIENAIKFFRNRSDGELNRHREIGFKIREEYFEPVTRKRVLKFLSINGDSTVGKS